MDGGRAVPTAYVLGDEGCTGECLSQFLLYLGFEVRREFHGEPGHVLVLLSDSTSGCEALNHDWIVSVVSSRAANKCGVLSEELHLSKALPLRVEKDRGRMIFLSETSLFLVFRELERLLIWRGLIWRTPPLERSDVLRELTRRTS